MITVVPGITGLIDRLETAGLVCRKRCDNDRRVVYVCISDKAVSLLGQIDEPLLKLHRALLGHLEAHELAALNQLLERAREPLVAEPAEA
jgi:DNA-binding MarR family transcriptional regulator